MRAHGLRWIDVRAVAASGDNGGLLPGSGVNLTPEFSLMDSAMNAMPSCPHCTLTNTYVDAANHVCADCGYEWPLVADEADEAATTVRDSNGNPLADGDTVVVIKDLKVKGSSIPLKQGTVIRQIRLVDGDPEHIEGHSEKIRGLVLKTCFLRKA
jgi:protein PhnA